MAGWHYWLNGHGFGWTPGVGDGQGGLACCGSWGHKESDTTEPLNWTELNWHESAMGVLVFSIWTPSHFPPHPIPQGQPSVPALSTLSHASNLDWQSTSQMIIYMFQSYSLKSSHPCLLPQSPNVCSLHLCLFCCLAYRVVVTISLNSIYLCICANIRYLSFSFWLTSLCIVGTSFIHLIRTDSNAFFFIAE